MNTLLKTNLGKVIHVHRVNGGTEPPPRLPRRCPLGSFFMDFPLYLPVLLDDIVRLLFLHVPFAYFCGFSQ